MHNECFTRHREHHREQSSRHDIFNLTRPGKGCVPCPMCRSIVSIAWPILPAGPPYRGDDDATASAASTSPRKPDDSLRDLVDRALQGLPRKADDRRGPSEAMLDACALQVLNTSAISPARAVPGEGAPPIHVAMLRLLSFSLGAPGVELPSDEELQGRDAKRLLLEGLGTAAGTAPASAAEFRRRARRLTEGRVRQLAVVAAVDGVDAMAAEGFASWLVFVAWVATSLFTFEGRDLNILAHLPGTPGEQVAVLWQMLFGPEPLDLPMLVAPPDGVDAALLSSAVPLCRDTGGLVTFCSLPTRLQDLLRQTYGKTCAKCGKVPTDPCLCLLCGQLLCSGLNKAPCLAPGSGGGVDMLGVKGNCQKHAEVCGASQGLFLVPYMGSIIAVSGTNNGIWEYPYVDVYGEPVPPTSSLDLTLDVRRVDRLRLALTLGTVGLEILRQSQRTSRYVPGDL